MEAIAIMGGMFALLISAAIVLSVFWIWMLIECIHNEEIKGIEKSYFLLRIIFLHFVGGAIYCFSAKRKERLGCFAIMTIITACFIGILSLAGIIKFINENQNSNLIRAREIINEFIDVNILNVERTTGQTNKPKPDKNSINSWWHPDYEPQPYKPLNQSATDKALVDPRNERKQNSTGNATESSKSKYVTIYKRDENRLPATTPKEMANINTTKYSEQMNSWIDSQGKVHFSNTGQSAAK